MQYLSIYPSIYPSDTVVYVFAIAVLRGVRYPEAHVNNNKNSTHPSHPFLPICSVRLFQNYHFYVLKLGYQDLAHVHVSPQQPQPPHTRC